MSGVAITLAFATLILTGAAAGLFFAFSICVMWGLDRSGGKAAIRAMQEINRAILNPVFLIAFMGAPVAGLAIAGLLWVDGLRAAAFWFGAGSATYLVGVLGLTMVVNVPMNQRLDRQPVPSDPAEADALWQAYSKRWTAWNHVRTVANLASLAAFGAGLFFWNSA